MYTLPNPYIILISETGHAIVQKPKTARYFIANVTGIATGTNQDLTHLAINTKTCKQLRTAKKWLKDITLKTLETFY